MTNLARNWKLAFQQVFWDLLFKAMNIFAQLYSENLYFLENNQHVEFPYNYKKITSGVHLKSILYFFKFSLKMSTEDPVKYFRQG